MGVQDIVINADPNHPPYALLWLTKLWNLPVDISVHLHSSVSALPEKLSSFTSLINVTSSESSIKVTFVWKEGNNIISVEKIMFQTIIGSFCWFD